MFASVYLTRVREYTIIPSLTVMEKQKRCKACKYKLAAFFVMDTESGNLRSSLTLLLDFFHFPFGDELKVGAEPTDFM